MNPLLLSLAELKPALAGLGKVIRKRSALPVLGCVRVQCTSADTVDLAVTDLDTTLVVTLHTPPHAGPGVVLIPSNELSHIARTCGPEDAIEVHAGAEPTSVVIKCPVGGQMAEHRLETCLAGDFPEVPEFRDPPIPLSERLRESIHAALECASVDPTRFVLNGAYLDVSRPEAHYVVGTNGRLLVASNSFKLSLAKSLIIPSNKFLEWKGFCGDGDWKLQVQPADEKQAGRFQIATHHWRFIAKDIDGRYPDWRVVLPDPNGYKTQVHFDSSTLAAVAQTIHRLPCHSEQHHTLGLEVNRRSLRLMGRSRQDVPWTKVEVPVKRITGAAVTVFVDREFLLKAFRFGLTRIGIVDDISPLHLTDEGSRQMVLMPLRPDADTAVAGTAPTSPPALPSPSAEEVTFSSDEPFPPQPAADTRPNTNTTTPMPTYEDAPPTTTTTTAVPEANGPGTATENANGKAINAITAMTAITPEPPEKPALEAALEHIEMVNAGFREGITSLGKLSEMLRQSMREQRASQREFQSVRQTLRSLQGVRI